MSTPEHEQFQRFLEAAKRLDGTRSDFELRIAKIARQRQVATTAIEGGSQINRSGNQ